MSCLSRIFLLIAVAIVTTGCVGPVAKIDTDPVAITKVKTISVIRSPEPKTYVVMNFGHPGMGFGLVGGLIVAADLSSKQDRITQSIKEQKLPPVSTILADNIAARLKAKGYDVRVEDGPWEENGNGFKIDFEKIKSSSDTVLVVAPGMYGFVTTSVVSDYMPTITAVVTLLGKNRKEPLYRGYHATGWQPKAEGWRHSPSKTTFANFDVLMADPKKTAVALNDATERIANTVAEDLRQKSK